MGANTAGSVGCRAREPRAVNGTGSRHIETSIRFRAVQWHPKSQKETNCRGWHSSNVSKAKISWALQMTDLLFDSSPAPEPSPAQKWDRDSARRALDELFTVAHQYNSSKSYLELMEFIGKFRSYSPFNAMLVHMQMPGRDLSPQRIGGSGNFVGKSRPVLALL